MQETWVRSMGRKDPPGGGKGNPPWDSCPENSTDRGAWRATVLGGPKESDMTEQLSVSTALLTGKFLSLLFDLRPGALKFTILRPLISKLPIS